MLKVLRSTIIETPAEAVWEILRDFNSHADWHPAIAASEIERSRTGDTVGCIRAFRLADGSELREQLLTLSDMEMSYSYCLLDTPVPLFNYVAHSRVLPVTDVDHAFWEWEARFDTRKGEERRMQALVGDDIFGAGFVALRERLSELGQVTGGGREKAR